jgi:esterase/lipase superfamily enzyme
MIFRRLLGLGARDAAVTTDDDPQALRARIAELEERLRSSQATARERSEALYVLQRQYSSEHFGYAESMRNLNIERMRNAGAYAAQDIMLSRYQSLQARIAGLKGRLRAHEHVDDLHEDDAPIVLDEPKDGG